MKMNEERLAMLMESLDAQGKEKKVEVYLRFLNELTVGGRGIVHVHPLATEARLEGMRRINEIFHRTLNHIGGIQQADDGVAIQWFDKETEAKFGRVLLN